ncbi:MAG TPA: PH domain-containing protein [Anaerolineae bacterium]|nr:PH domain-containing protein [Anaerolineae bacterium]
MGYVEQLLAKGEEIVLRARQHWVTLIASALANALFVIVVLVLYFVVRSIEFLKPAETVLLVAALIGVLFGLARYSWDWLRWWSEEYIVTSRRVIQTEGIVNKRTADSSLEKVNDVLLTQSFFGRILGYGDLEIVTGSDVGVNRLTRLRDPINFKTAMLDAKARLGEEYGEQMREVTDRDVPKLIEELDALRKRGLITDAEFNEKKARLLSQL